MLVVSSEVIEVDSGTFKDSTVEEAVAVPLLDKDSEMCSEEESEDTVNETGDDVLAISAFETFIGVSDEAAFSLVVTVVEEAPNRSKVVERELKDGTVEEETGVSTELVGVNADAGFTEELVSEASEVDELDSAM